MHVDCPLCYIQHSVCINCYNRAYALDNAYRILLHDNIAADIKGDGFSVDSVLYEGEVANIFSHNLVVGTLNAPGFLEKGMVGGTGFFIPGPAQYFRDNVVAATSNRGFYFRCPCIYENFLWPILEFENNYVHGVGLGFDTYFLFPRETPLTGPMDLLCRMPYQNDIKYRPSHTNILNNFTLFSNIEDINLRAAGPLTLSNSVLIDSYSTSLTIGLSDYLEIVKVINVTFRCRDTGGSAIATGVWSDNVIRNVTFSNYNTVPAVHADAAWLPTFGELYWMRFSLIIWDNTTNYVKWEGGDLWIDEDGSFAGVANSTITPYQPHLDMGEPLCDILGEGYGNALRCREEVQIRPFTIDQLTPEELYYSTLTLRREGEGEKSGADPTFYTEHTFWSNYTNRFKYTPWEYMDNCFKVPVVLGETYWVRWRDDSDFVDMRIFPYHRWDHNDQNVILKFRYYEKKEYLDVFRVTQDNMCNHTYERVSELEVIEDLEEPEANIGEYYNDIDSKLLNIILGKKPEEIDWVKVSGPISTSVDGGDSDTNTPMTDGYWSEPESWPSGTVPTPGDDVIIEKSRRIVLDTNSTALNSLIILGELHIQSMGAEVLLQSRLIEIRAGALIAGSLHLPYEGRARIQITSTPGDLSESVRYGSIFSYGRLQLIGKRGRSCRRAQMLEGSGVGDNRLIITGGLGDWVEGDIVLVEASGFGGEGERRYIYTYDSRLGVLTLGAPLLYSHSQYAGVYNMGGYHIVVEGGEIDVEDRVYGETGAYCVPETYISGVLFRGMGGQGESPMAIRFYYYNYNSADLERISIIKNSGFIDLNSGALEAFDSRNIEFRNNIIYRPYRLGVHVERVHNLTVSENVILSVEDEEWESWSLSKGLPLQGGFFISPFSSESADLVFTSNKVIGSDTIGIATYGEGCGSGNGVSEGENSDNNTNTQNTIFLYNTVQSTTYIGWFLATDVPKCISLTQFTMRHNLNYSVFVESNTRAVQLSNGVFDSCVESIGFGAGVFNHTINATYTGITFIGSNNYGNLLNTKKRPTLGRAIGYEFDNVGIEYRYVDPDPTQNMNMTDVSGVFRNITFIGYKDMGMGIPVNVNAALYLSDRFGTMGHKFSYPYIYFSDIYIVDTDINLFILSETWFQHLLVFENTHLPDTWILNNSAVISNNFQLINNTQNIGDYLANCHYQSGWNMYYCNNPDLGVLCIDTNMKIATVAHLTREDGYHSSDFSRWEISTDNSISRVSHLVHTVETTRELNIYNLTFEGSTPEKMGYFLLGQKNDPSKYIYIRTYYKKPMSIHIFEGGNQVNQMVYSSEESVSGTDHHMSKCGENIWNVHENVLEVNIIGDEECNVQSEAVNALWLSLRLKCDVSKFYSDKGPATFIQQISSVLGIPGYRIRVVGIYAGSTKVIAFLDQDILETDGDKAKLELTQLSNILQTTIANNQIDFGSEILEFLVKEAFLGEIVEEINVDANSDSDSNSKKYNIGLIIGLCCVAVFLILAGLIVFIIYKKKKASGEKVGPVDESMPEEGPVEEKIFNSDCGIFVQGEEPEPVVDALACPGRKPTGESFIKVLNTEIPQGVKEEDSDTLRPITEGSSAQKRIILPKIQHDRFLTPLGIRVSTKSPSLHVVSFELAKRGEERKE